MHHLATSATYDAIPQYAFGEMRCILRKALEHSRSIDRPFQDFPGPDRYACRCRRLFLVHYCAISGLRELQRDLPDAIARLAPVPTHSE